MPAHCTGPAGAATVDRYFYREPLKVLVARLTRGQWLLSPEELVEPVAFQEAAHRSAQRGGDEVRLATA